MTTEIATAAGGLAGLKNALLPQNFEQVLRFADMVKDTEFVPKDFRGRPGHIVAAVTYGAELGLTPMQALNSVAVINGRPALFGDGLLAVCQGRPQWDGMDESITGTGDARTAQCVVRRKGAPIVVRTFSMADAKRAQLSGKQGPWSQYPDRMLQMRARGFALRDQFADALKGVLGQHEAQDLPRDVTPPAQERVNVETRRKAMEEVEAAEVVTVYGTVDHVPPHELQAWIVEQASEPVDEAALEAWADANAAVPGVREEAEEAIAKKQLAAKAAAKPNGASSPELKALYRDAKGALDRGEYEAAVKAKVRAFELTEDATVRARFDELFVEQEQRELV